MSATDGAAVLPAGPFPRETPWEEIAGRAPQMVATMHAYLEQVAVSHRAASVAAYSLALRHMAAYVTASDPRCRRFGDPLEVWRHGL